MKRENRTIKKDNLIEITGNRTELKQFEGTVLNAHCFITNTNGYMGDKRLVTELRIPGTNYFVKHLWLKAHKIGNLPHGYTKLELKVVSYLDQVTLEEKFGFKYVGKKGKVHEDTSMKIPKWKREMEEDEALKKANVKTAKTSNITKTPKPKKPYNKIRKIRVVTKAGA